MLLHRKNLCPRSLLGCMMQVAGDGGRVHSITAVMECQNLNSSHTPAASSQQPGGRGINFRLAPNFMIAAKQQHTVWKYLGISAPLSVDYARPWVLVRPWRSNSEQLKITSIKRSLVLVSIRSEDMSLNADQVVTY